MDLALFDLDHTLIPFDSGMAWTRFLAGRGVLPATAPDDYLAACQAYVDGKLDIVALHRATVAPLGAFPSTAIEFWATEFEAAMAPQLPALMQALVRRHRNAGALCALVTATTRFIAEPFARLFDIPYVIATESARDARGRFTGEIVGQPCFREHKRSRVDDWLSARSLHCCAFERSWFYTDSFNDLPLLEAVSQPVAVRPDVRLRAQAQRAGWAIVED
ncbi:HAD family phosphatase [Paucibacter sp. R3-3]|uniref:HAD family phosphatase n=1 Tax=Roseateles agri TaxID=3098619 RepID=A0ABU5DU16_9BURK|nr:HAD family phosphatase [Paucibacter sp. R3-3]MDY0748827.1 HAD family phosphatase [Paucibacter sp. R3-3]